MAPHVLPGRMVVLASIAIHFIVVLPDASTVATCPSKCECARGGMVKCIRGSHTKIPEDVPVNTPELFLYEIRFDSPVLTRANFSRLTNLRELYVGGCGIESIEADTFKDLKNLRYLYLKENHLKVLQRNTFNGLNLRGLELTNNPGIKLVPDSFSGLSVYQLYLNRCSLKDLNPEVFYPLKSSLQILVLENNELTGLSDGFQTVFNSLKYLYISGNPFNCDCNLAWLKDFVGSHEDMLKFDRPLSCQSPAALKGKNIRDLQSSDFHCQLLSWMN